MINGKNVLIRDYSIVWTLGIREGLYAWVTLDEKC